MNDGSRDGSFVGLVVNDRGGVTEDTVADSNGIADTGISIGDEEGVDVDVTVDVADGVNACVLVFFIDIRTVAVAVYLADADKVERDAGDEVDVDDGSASRSN